MHQTLALSSDFSFVCRPQTAGGHSHRAPAISEVIRLPEETGEAYSFAKTVTLYLKQGWYLRDKWDWAPTNDLRRQNLYVSLDFFSLLYKLFFIYRKISQWQTYPLFNNCKALVIPTTPPPIINTRGAFWAFWDETKKVCSVPLCVSCSFLS